MEDKDLHHQNPLRPDGSPEPEGPPSSEISPAIPSISSPIAPVPTYVDVTRLRLTSEMVREQLSKVIIGQEPFIDLLLIALFSGGHVLVEGVPGIAKTLTARMLARSLDVEFSRIQFTPDLMPSDVTGTTVFNVKNSEFTFNAGPIFSNLVLIDEINRAPAKTQSALFEVMEEQQITVDGTSYAMDFPFFVVATQNPIEQEGTYKLPEAQLDRFLFRVLLHYPKLEEEKSILRRYRSDFRQTQIEEVRPVVTKSDIKACQRIVEQVYIRDELLDYIAAVIHNTRENADLFLGASPRASLAIMKAAKAQAALQGRDFVTPDDIQYVAFPVLNHRIILTPEREMEGTDVESTIRQLVEEVEVPR